MATSFDRATEDVGNIVGLEHINTRVPDPIAATDFYISGMGFTRDPYMNVGTDNMWINVGSQQFHLPTGAPQVLRGQVGIVVPDLNTLTDRLDRVRGKLSATAFAFERINGHVDVTTPWGNQLRCHEPAEAFGTMRLGVPYVEFTVPIGTADGIARFYRDVFLAEATLEVGGTCARVTSGPNQSMRFRESDAPQAVYDNHHVAIYISNFSAPYRWLLEHDRITEESNAYQFRFLDIVDPATNEPLFTIEHEVRSFTHPMYARPMVNRNPDQTQATYVRGRDVFYP